MRTHTYKIPATGKDLVNKEWAGRDVTTDQPQTVAEAVPKYFATEEALVAAACRDRMIGQNRVIRHAKAGTAFEEAVRQANELVVKIRPEGDGTSKPKSSGAIKRLKAENEAAKTERASRLEAYRKIRADQPSVFKSMVKAGAVTQADIDALDAPAEAPVAQA